MTAKQKWTSKARRGIAHLFRELTTDSDHGLAEYEHRMYRRLKLPEKRELQALILWLNQEMQRGEERPVIPPDPPRATLSIESIEVEVTRDA